MDSAAIGKVALPVNDTLAKIIGLTKPQEKEFEIPFGEGAVMRFKTVDNHLILEDIAAKVELFLKTLAKPGLVPEQFKPYIVKNQTALASCAALAATVVEPVTSEYEFMVMYAEAPLLFRFINDEWAKHNNGANQLAESEELEAAKKD
jgi:hypothetical protein